MVLWFEGLIELSKCRTIERQNFRTAFFILDSGFFKLFAAAFLFPDPDFNNIYGFGIKIPGSFKKIKSYLRIYIFPPVRL